MPRTSRFVIGIDLGTTNCALAWADLDEVASSDVPRVRRFATPQLVADGEVGAHMTLPSFLYLASADERASGLLDLPWNTRPDRVVGAWARDHGALLPGRLVMSAKSWLSYGEVDRRAPILPWDADPDERVCSPVDASTAYLAHLRDAWNYSMSAGADALRLEHQDIVLTVPASFDEEARELTVEAARAAGFERLTLQEEPTAALYAWLASHRGRLATHLRAGDTVLVCDVGGGTTDLTLVQVATSGDELAFERVAVGDHLLLGGDNVDLALARMLESRLKGGPLTLRQRQALRRQTAAAKERLLGPDAPDRVSISVLGSGRSVVGGAQAVDLTADDVRQVLFEGFLPGVERDARPRRDARTGLRELGLPFEADPAITRHLATFLGERTGGSPPDAVLLNGGFFTPVSARERLASVVEGWFAGTAGWRLRVLANESPTTAVAEGAACYGLVRHGLGVRIGGGSPRAYFVGLQAQEIAEGGIPALCVLPRGAEEGSRYEVAGRDLEVVANRPRAFSLWSSRSRKDALGDLVHVDPEVEHRHAPLVAELRFGKRSRSATIPVRLDVAYTELGTLELWLRSRDTDHRWRLQFELRGTRAQPTGALATHAQAVVGEEALSAATGAIKAAFAADTDRGRPGLEQLPSTLESVLGLGRHAWPVAVIRPLADALLDAADSRRASAHHEARWVNLFGFCLRPGFGATLDEWRVTQARRLQLAGSPFPNDVQCQAEWLVLWQRIAGGLSAGQQQDLYQRHAPPLLASIGKRGKRLSPQVERETWRMLASLERLPAVTRAALGEQVLDRLQAQPDNSSLWWALGRVGARESVYGPLNTVVAPARVQEWIGRILPWTPATPEAWAAVADLGAMTGDAARDLDEGTRERVSQYLQGVAAEPLLLRRLAEPRRESRAELQRRFGESLPEGLALAGEVS